MRNFVVKLERGEGGVVGACMSVCVGPVSYTDSESLVAHSKLDSLAIFVRTSDPVFLCSGEPLKN